MTGRDRRARPATPERLKRGALAYLERYASSTANLRRLLLRRVARSAAEHGTDPEEGRAAVEAILEALTRAGLLDDRAFAAARAATLRRRGLSRQGAMAALARSGIGREAAEAVLPDTDADDLAAAAAFARRRRLGPYRPAEARAEHRLRDLAALGRRGFGPGVARRVIDAEDPSAFDEEA